MASMFNLKKRMALCSCGIMVYPVCVPGSVKQEGCRLLKTITIAGVITGLVGVMLYVHGLFQVEMANDCNRAFECNGMYCHIYCVLISLIPSGSCNFHEGEKEATHCSNRQHYCEFYTTFQGTGTCWQCHQHCSLPKLAAEECRICMDTCQGREFSASRCIPGQEKPYFFLGSILCAAGAATTTAAMCSLCLCTERNSQNSRRRQPIIPEAVATGPFQETALVEAQPAAVVDIVAVLGVSQAPTNTEVPTARAISIKGEQPASLPLPMATSTRIVHAHASIVI